MIKYRTDSEYEDQFFALFQQSVARRTADGDPILAQLSGGMDSTSIVCMSDYIRQSDDCSTNDLLDTISYLSPSEPNWDEEPYITATEARRGKIGIHLEVLSSEGMAEAPSPEAGRILFPGVTAAVTGFQARFRAAMKGKEYRVILSGIGGDEVLGGIPTPGPELANYLLRLDLSTLFSQALKWSVALRIPIVGLLVDTARLATSLALAETGSVPLQPEWLAPRLRKLENSAFDSEFRLVERVRSLPSTLSNGQAWSTILETLPNLWPAPGIRYEYRYPYLDRDLVDFLFRIPPQQITRPGRRRSLMRRGLKCILPTEVLERRRKAYISRGPIVALQNSRSPIESLLGNPVLGEMGWIDSKALRLFAEAVLSGHDITRWSLLLRALTVEIWLRSASTRHLNSSRLSGSHSVLFEALEHPRSV
jgi:asparagine synthase (glutamine-hydrolysing)